jgi:hypothetical protein
MQFFGEFSVDYCFGITSIEQEVEGTGSVDGDGYDNHGVSHYPEPDLERLLAETRCEGGEIEGDGDKGEKSTGETD